MGGVISSSWCYSRYVCQSLVFQIPPPPPTPPTPQPARLGQCKFRQNCKGYRVVTQGCLSQNLGVPTWHIICREFTSEKTVSDPNLFIEHRRLWGVNTGLIVSKSQWCPRKQKATECSHGNDHPEKSVFPPDTEGCGAFTGNDHTHSLVFPPDAEGCGAFTGNDHTQSLVFPPDTEGHRAFTKTRSFPQDPQDDKRLLCCQAHSCSNADIPLSTTRPSLFSAENNVQCSRETSKAIWC